MLDVINPASGQKITTLNTPSDDELNQIFTSLKNEKNVAPLNERKAALIAFGQDLEKNRHELAKVLSDEVGKPIRQAHGELKDTISRIQFFADNIDQVMKTRTFLGRGEVKEEIQFDPLGLILCISAWNYPYFVSTNVILPALVSGCRVIFKPSELAALSGKNMGDLLKKQDAFKNIFEVVNGGKEIGAKLVEKNFEGIFFTGSEKAGLAIKKSIGERMIKSQFELGGKDAAYLCEDCDLEKSIEAVMDGAFFNCGQSCCSIERIYVHKNIANDAKCKMIDMVKNFKVGSPSEGDTYLGPLTRKEQIPFLLSQIDDAVQKGASVVVGGKKMERDGYFFEPTLIFDANSSMSIMTEESFGPIVAVEEVASDEEAIEKINASRFGLTSSVFSQDESRARKIMGQLESGTVYLNCCDRVSSNLPWSGRKNSGLGATLSTIGMEMFLKPKAWHLKTF